ncbi:hypothetical protein EVAR_96485_1 [Eumeta japonica]|uniref:Uncharacterized protein n=1 Tax=Eumeta variegata TaxID=151549 RepID=A0A4C1ZXA4_EUMVA|nr:hypothetical protein EVAR_96485_1 [Eumeta japonica]
MIRTLFHITEEEDPSPAEHRPTDDHGSGASPAGFLTSLIRAHMDSSGTSHRRTRGRRAADRSSEKSPKRLPPNSEAEPARARRLIGFPKGDHNHRNRRVVSPTRRRPGMRQHSLHTRHQTCMQSADQEEERRVREFFVDSDTTTTREYYVSPAETARTILRLPKRKAPGPDGIPTIAIKLLEEPWWRLPGSSKGYCGRGTFQDPEDGTRHCYPEGRQRPSTCVKSAPDYAAVPHRQVV